MDSEDFEIEEVSVESWTVLRSDVVVVDDCDGRSAPGASSCSNVWVSSSVRPLSFKNWVFLSLVLSLTVSSFRNFRACSSKEERESVVGAIEASDCSSASGF